ncbi:MAG TPA: PAS domain S-box protein [Noviherbaspirillum sp.]|jgi:diguanylate cyclase (GGDEF)-like protein/PAS domain S-box-containing protein|uniref:PAS domain S-box protein n=1 Tax=Noviherbaspirillum sp. TaxID=1926288 RepID=UPI002F931D9B
MDLPFRPSGDSDDAQRALRRLADTASMIIWITDASDVCTYISSPDIRPELIGSALSMWVEFIHPDDRTRVAPVFYGAKQEKKEYQVEYRVVGSGGTERWMRGSAAPRFSADGVYEGYVGAIVDISSHHDARRELAQSEATHRLLTENSSDLISHHALDGRLLNISPASKRVLGFDPAEMTGSTVYDHVHHDDVVAMHALVKQLDQREESDLFELRFRHKDGHYVWTACKARALIDPVTGERTGTVSVGRDVTLERRAKEELKRREERFRSLTNLSSDWYWETDEEDRLTFASEGAWRVSGAAPEGVIGRTRLELAVDKESFLKTGYMARFTAREPFRDLRYACSWSLEGMQRYVSISGEPVFENGEFRGYRGVGRDITDEVAMAERLAALAAENKSLIDNSLDIMMLFGDDGRVLRVNAAIHHILGYRPEELLHRHYLDFVLPEDHARTLALRERLRDGEHIVAEFENRWLRQDGTAVHLSWAVRWESNTRLTYATARDITEAHRNRAELHRSNRRLYAILESIGDAFFALDREWRCTFANHKTAQFIRLPKEQIVGSLLWEAVPEILGTPFMAEYRKVMETRRKAFFVACWEPTSTWIEVRVYPSETGISIFFHDVTARRRAESAIRESEQRFRQVIEMTPAGYVLTDERGILVDVNPALCGMSGYQKEQLLGRALGELFPVFPLEPALPGAPSAAAMHGREAVLRHRNGQPVYVLVNLDVRGGAEGAGAVTAFITDITQRKQAEARLEQLATHDTLTDLPNRSFLNDRLQQMLDAAGPHTEIAVIFIDLDRFKEVNDSLGHERGDLLLREVAGRLQRNMRPTDFVARLGGDEFVVAAHCAEGASSAAIIADKLLAVLAEPIDIAGHEVFVGASAGISIFPRDGGTREILFQNADTAMYRAKNAGRNGYCFFEHEMSVEAKTRMTLEQSLRRALERNEFELHYQPRLELRSGRVLGMEALLRWNHPQLGQVSPLQFIPIAEERGLIEAIGRWVLQEACAQTRRMTDKFGLPLRVSVNLSARQLKCQDLREQVLAALDDAGLPAQMLELELTESALIEDMEVSASRLSALKKLGIMLSVDDFGTGYSGLAYLQRFPLDAMKLDRAFINQQTDGTRNLHFIKALIDLAHTLNLSVVAEGIESPDILQFLKSCRCDEGQGYLFARPLPIAQFEDYVEQMMAERIAG